MNFIPIGSVGLDINIDLNVLKRSSQPYSILMYQHEGVLSATKNKIGNANNVDSQFNAFFSLVNEKGKEADLVLTPEYSCPWAIINSLLADQAKLPAKEKLWIIGCESITKDELISFKRTCEEKGYIIFYEEAVLKSTKNLLDPIVYLFKANQNDIEKLIVLIQFKTHHMGVWNSPIERDSIIEGENIYILKNSANPSIYLLSLICSEAMNFPNDFTSLSPEEKNAIDWEDKPFLIFNPQFNPKPNHEKFIAFREFVFQSNNKEVISLNWHINSKIGDNNMFQNSSSQSGFYIKSDQINTDDRTRIKTNHKHGIYYFNQNRDRHSYILNGLIHVFKIELPHVAISGVLPEQARRDGPLLTSIYIFNSKGNYETPSQGISDGHIEYITNKLGCENIFLINATNCIIEKESLVCLTTGMINKGTDRFWYKIHNLKSFVMDSKDVNRRLTYIQGDNSESITEIKKYISTIISLDGILTNPNMFPESIIDLKDEKISIGYSNTSSNEHYRYNVVDENGNEVKATILYLGLAPTDEVEIVYEKLRNLFDNNNKGRVVIYYMRGADTKMKFDERAGNISNDNAFEPSSYRKNNS